ncbi:50S ribosomal protein L31 [bacterium]|jgi:large subunit ribosomal protein L31|nr:50S ribosomal protein L31 [bacterium]MBT3903976.1 50S ribosomal protein L31 [bacterium]MBT4577784.1 50S ribosomal protein L31 [bacterium]MBT5346083.1 50S ribosomal protein L31 [bacterium]MBT6131352.1 50S ribosomal protein L31 [bacterium]
MKKNLHPEMLEVTATCACGHSFKTQSVLPELKSTLCSNCHPFFTGKQKFVDTAGRIEKFMKKFGETKKAAPAKSEEKPDAPAATTDE